MLDLDSFVTELLKQKSVNGGILELSDQVKSEPCLREILLLARETDQFSRGLKTNNEKEAEINLRECLDLSILKTERDYLYNSGRRVFEKIITAKKDKLREARNQESVHKEFESQTSSNITFDFEDLKLASAKKTARHSKTRWVQNYMKPLKKRLEEIQSLGFSEALQRLTAILLLAGMPTAGIALLLTEQQAKKTTPSLLEQDRSESTNKQFNTEDHNERFAGKHNSTRLRPGDIHVVVNEIAVDNIESLYDILSKDLSGSLNCAVLRQLAPLSISMAESTLPLCEINTEPKSLLTAAGSSTARLDKNNLEWLNQLDDLTYSPEQENIKYASIYGYYISRTSYLASSRDNSNHFSSNSDFKQKEITSISDLEAEILTLKEYPESQFALYRNASTSKTWLENFAHINNKGLLRSHYIRTEPPLTNRHCLGKLGEESSHTDQTIYINCYELQGKFRGSLAGARRVFYPQVLLTMESYNNKTGEQKLYTCHNESTESMLNTMPLINELAPINKRIYNNYLGNFSTNCGNSDIKLNHKDNTSIQTKNTYPYDKLIELDSIIDRKKKRYSTKRTEENQYSEWNMYKFHGEHRRCDTKHDLLDGKIIVWHTCSDKYQVIDSDSGEPTNTTLTMKYLDTIGVLLPSTTAEFNDPDI